MVTHWLSFMYLYLMVSLLCDLDCADEWFVCLVGLVGCGLVDIEHDVLWLFVWCLVGGLLGVLLISLVFVVLGGFVGWWMVLVCECSVWSCLRFTWVWVD